MEAVEKVATDRTPINFVITMMEFSECEPNEDTSLDLLADMKDLLGLDL